MVIEKGGQLAAFFIGGGGKKKAITKRRSLKEQTVMKRLRFDGKESRDRTLEGVGEANIRHYLCGQQAEDNVVQSAVPSWHSA